MQTVTQSGQHSAQRVCNLTKFRKGLNESYKTHARVT